MFSQQKKSSKVHVFLKASQNLLILINVHIVKEINKMNLINLGFAIQILDSTKFQILVLEV